MSDPLHNFSLNLKARRGEPLYVTLRNELLQMIRKGDWPKDMAIPSERNLAALLDVSRSTVRQALLDLEHDHWVERRQGFGTFVSEGRREHSTGHLAGFTQSMQASGFEPQTKVIHCGLISCPPAVAETLGLEENEAVARISRLRLVDQIPSLFEICYIADRIAPGLTQCDLSGSLYACLWERYRLAPHTGRETVEIADCPSDVAGHLEHDHRKPILFSERRSFTQSGQPLELTLRYANPKTTRFRIELGASRAEYETRMQPGNASTEKN